MNLILRPTRAKNVIGVDHHSIAVSRASFQFCVAKTEVIHPHLEMGKEIINLTMLSIQPVI